MRIFIGDTVLPEKFGKIGRAEKKYFWNLGYFYNNLI
jgi:hypothetical protein